MSGYNGWTNYETWNVALWWDNDQGSYNERCERVQEAYEATDEDATPGERREEAARTVADWLKEATNEMAPDLGASLYADLLGAALSEVNWDEIANNWLEEVAEPA
jgi:hypothetical protein